MIFSFKEHFDYNIHDRNLEKTQWITNPKRGNGGALGNCLFDKLKNLAKNFLLSLLWAQTESAKTKAKCFTSLLFTQVLEREQAPKWTKLSAAKLTKKNKTPFPYNERKKLQTPHSSSLLPVFLTKKKPPFSNIRTVLFYPLRRGLNASSDAWDRRSLAFFHFSEVWCTKMRCLSVLLRLKKGDGVHSSLFTCKPPRKRWKQLRWMIIVGIKKVWHGSWLGEAWLLIVA